MHIRYQWRLIAAAMAFALPTLSHAAVLQVNGAGQLTGATGVNVDGTLYDVAFVDSSCSATFSGCDQSSDFTFTTVADANAAAQALLDQVFVDTPAGSFDTNPALTLGCSSPVTCSAIVPFRSPSIFNPVGFDAAIATNGAAESSDVVITSPLGVYGGSQNYDFSLDPTLVLAKFSLASGVPEPATWAMMLLGFGAIGFGMRRRNSAAAPLAYR